MLKLIGVGLGLFLAGGMGAAYASYRSKMAEAEDVWRAIAARAKASQQQRFDPEAIGNLPEIAQRYFRHAIAPGTPLSTTAQLGMRGTFLLGEKDGYQRYKMKARQILRPPFEFVWMPRLQSGAMTITGSDALADGRAWTRFWLMGLVPVANAQTSADMVRSAAFRAATEGLWVPASLLPQNGVRWEQAGPDQARLTITSVNPEIVFDLTLASNGAVQEIVGFRWSDANPQQQFQLQRFGGTVERERSFGGYTIPARLKVGNHYGTSDYLPFFQAEIVSATYL